jgi:hypothetical protein
MKTKFCVDNNSQISQLELSFKEIIFGYRKQPQCKPQVFRSVYVHWAPRSRNGVSSIMFSAFKGFFKLLKSQQVRKFV